MAQEKFMIGKISVGRNQNRITLPKKDWDGISYVVVTPISQDKIQKYLDGVK